ncbi:hypothetical protein RFI_13793 [Reticulomyxa filosa]|uniref:Uncharacterized protein n=1 Tax=Reticulomyxa filosa TaxID=46433 RepID=X6NCB5_RETFI|nr:hypothetical protein RFI_13793 [Reticulomyxa filosa]|eukprot:ETO23389.1 hypothetical protein RFI_13793 [Reticulomyxa filosa]
MYRVLRWFKEEDEVHLYHFQRKLTKASFYEQLYPEIFKEKKKEQKKAFGVHNQPQLQPDHSTSVYHHYDAGDKVSHHPPQQQQPQRQRKGSIKALDFIDEHDGMEWVVPMGSKMSETPHFPYPANDMTTYHQADFRRDTPPLIHQDTNNSGICCLKTGDKTFVITCEHPNKTYS